MPKQNTNLHNWGTTLASLGGLVVILNMTSWADSEWKSAFSWLAVILVFFGIFLVNKAKSTKDQSV